MRIGTGSRLEIDGFGRMMDAEFMNRTNDNLVEGERGIYMSKFSFETDYDMNDPLKDLGMGIAFDSDNADFSGLKEPSPYISDVIHKAFINVDESGTEAAAATAVLMKDSM